MDVERSSTTSIVVHEILRFDLEEYIQKDVASTYVFTRNKKLTYTLLSSLYYDRSVMVGGVYFF